MCHQPSPRSWTTVSLRARATSMSTLYSTELIRGFVWWTMESAWALHPGGGHALRRPAELRGGGAGSLWPGAQDSITQSVPKTHLASRRAPERCRVEIRQWDLDHVARTNRWEALKSTRRMHLLSLWRHCRVIRVRSSSGRDWTNLEYKLPGGAAARGGFATLAVEVGAHIAMVFHRFLSGETRSRKRLDIRVNGQALRPWDPYARREPHTRVLPRQVIGIPTVRGRPRLIVQPYLLPSQERFSSSTAHVGASGPHRWNRQQGFYFYRNDRLIQTGGWNRLRTWMNTPSSRGSRLIFRLGVTNSLA